MNNTIEVLEELLYEAEHAYDNCVEGMKEDWGEKIDALTKAITTLKVLESADGLLEKREYPSGCSYEEEYEEGYDCSNKCDGCIHGFEKGKVQGFNQAIDLYQKVLAKQILKVKELEAEAKLGNIPYKEAIALKAENKELKEQQLTVDTIEKVFDKHTIIANSDILYRKDLAIAIIKAREAKQHRTCDPECPFYKTEEASK